MAKRHRQTAGPGWALLAGPAREHRLKPTRAEDALWQALRNAQLGVRFRRQHVIDRFIVDFVCLRLDLVVEVDGPGHESEDSRDTARDARMLGLGYHTVRFTNEQVLNRLDAVVDAIRREIQEATFQIR
jgi:very-short-patch-repair endonuclease